LTFLSRTRERCPAVAGGTGGLVAALLTLGAWLTGCATTNPWPEMTPAELAPAPVALRAEMFYRAGPWTKVYELGNEAERAGGARLIRRCSAPESDETWQVGTFEVARKGAEERKLQTITLGSDGTGGIVLIELVDLVQSTRTAFDPPMLMLPGKLESGVAAETKSQASVSSLATPEKVIQRGPVRLLTVFTADLDNADAFRVRQTMKIELGGSVVERRTFHTGRYSEGVSAEDEMLTVTVGPFTVLSKSRRLRLTQTSDDGMTR